MHTADRSSLASLSTSLSTSLCRLSVSLLGLLGVLGLWGCGDAQLPDSVKRRSGTVLVDGCGLDSFQETSLLSDNTRAVVSEIILLCLYVRDDLASPLAPADRRSLTETVTQLHQRGYRVQLAVTTGEPVTQTPSKLEALLRDPARRALLTSSVVDYSSLVDGVVIAPPQLSNGSESAFRTWLGELTSALPSLRVSLFSPPSSESPSDIPGGDAISLSALRSQLAQVYLMTLDLHCCDGTPGPTTASDWIANVALFAKPLLGATPLSIALPLYGTHYGAKTQREVSYLEAVGLAGAEHIQILRDESGALHFDYTDSSGALAHVYFDDAHSTLQTLSNLDQTVPAEVGVLYYGVGAEDPALWATLKERMK